MPRGERRVAAIRDRCALGGLFGLYAPLWDLLALALGAPPYDSTATNSFFIAPRHLFVLNGPCKCAWWDRGSLANSASDWLRFYPVLGFDSKFASALPPASSRATSPHGPPTSLNSTFIFPPYRTHGDRVPSLFDTNQSHVRPHAYERTGATSKY
ncbi:hypothetical protein B0H15DRAFT_957100 [Mycena belliarum]|uniref:Uncharacterized protein n=1 Tax=Mycena belliarum TaxID=1033014 RepID=A0AAD6TPD0_9AGAR|nr:hypothetical protein B0H15DRAFT_957100 [Mycena belliae]